MFQTMCHGIVVRGKADEQGGGLYAELCGEVYGYQSGCAEAPGDIESRTVIINIRSFASGAWPEHCTGFGIGF